MEVGTKRAAAWQKPASGLLAHKLARIVLRRMPPPVLNVANARRGLGDTFDWFEREDGSRVRLLSRCRDTAKGRWRSTWWPVRVLAQLQEAGKLPVEETALLAEIEHARTLPMPTAELATVAHSLAERLPDDVVHTGIRDATAGVEIVEVVPSSERLAALAAGYHAAAITVRRAAERAGVPFERARILDIGTGSGYLAFALTGLGAREVVGIDLDIDGFRLPLERSLMRSALADTRSDCVRLEERDVADLAAFESGSFDIVCSMAAIEHLVDLDTCLAELHRVLRPGGLTHHGVDPWFGKAGGHSLCSLDFPWGHVRLSKNDLFRYLQQLRPHEFEAARLSYETGFPSPRLTLDESKAAFERAGFNIVDWIEVQLPFRHPFRAALNRHVLADCRTRHPSATVRDLLSIGFTVTARR